MPIQPTCNSRIHRTVMSACVVAACTGGVRADVLSFRQGEGGYTSASDTFLQQDPVSSGNDNGTATAIGWDNDDPSGSGFDTYVLMQFASVFGGAAGQVPLGAEITEATLYLSVFNSGNAGSVHAVLDPWDDIDSFSSFCGVGCAEGAQHGPQTASAPGAIGQIAINVTASVQAWSDGNANYGWIVRPQFGGNDGVDVRSSEYGTLSARPRLEIRHSEGPPPVGLVRQPYLQKAGPNTMTVAWRTENPTDSVVHYGTTQGNLNQTASDAAIDIDHFVEITGLQPGTIYYYDVGSSQSVLAGGDADHHFATPPTVGTPAAVRAWIVGDSGTGGADQANVRNAMLTATAGNPPDIFIHVGDMAYDNGTTDEFTFNHFAPYQDILRHATFWPAIGNHEGANSDSPSESGPYYEAFDLPRAGESGGVASTTEAYYSFDHGNVHFICLDSHDTPRSPGSAMLLWLEQDLIDTTQDWIVVFFHHPPYTKGSHNSDSAGDSGGRLTDMRENVLPILEAGGVDVVLGGHSHIYERSYLIDGAYGYGSAPNFVTPGLATLQANGDIVDNGDGDPSGNGAYLKPTGLLSNQGTVYVVAGHGGRGTSQQGVHPVMVFTENDHGSCILDIDDNMLVLQNIRDDGQVTDTFSIVKGGCATNNDCAPLTNACNDGVCSGGTCIQVPVNEGGSCSDGAFCNGAETCSAGNCVGGAAPCPGQLCDEGANACVECLSDGDCPDDGLFCNGSETCVTGACQSSGDPCAGQPCDEVADQCVNPNCNDDGTCDAGEDCTTCPADCFSAAGAQCGNGLCEMFDGEDCLSCPTDCRGKQNGNPNRRYCCGDGAGNNPVGCEDSRCSSGEFSCTEQPAAASCCGDGTCDGGEDSLNCAVDCGALPFCGDGLCNGSEDTCDCAADCGAPPATETDCADGSDEDCDGQTDCDDTDCAGAAACQCDGDGTCESGEDCTTCPQDCPTFGGAGCGNDVCEPSIGEDCLSCPADCNGKQNGRPSNRYCCGDGDGQNPVGCNDGRCDGGGNSCSDQPAVAACCGDGLCEGAEDAANCGIDCN